MYKRFGKRLFDLALVIPAILGALPLALLVVLAVAVGVDRRVFFRQRRPGLQGRPFVLYKFRTMREGYDDQGRALPDGKRLTPVGRWLRRASLDELPELFNVLKGEMSLVGPRPLLLHYLDLYTVEQRRRHELRPGITGWAQVHGRNAQSWDERFALDLWYVDHASLAYDVKILALTVQKVLSREGIAAPGHSTMPEFRGSQGEGPAYELDEMGGQRRGLELD